MLPEGRQAQVAQRALHQPGLAVLHRIIKEKCIRVGERPQSQRRGERPTRFDYLADEHLGETSDGHYDIGGARLL